MRKLITYGLLLAGLMLTMGGAAMASPAEPGAGPDFTATYSYNEECNNEGCSTEEVRELHRSYYNECSAAPGGTLYVVGGNWCTDEELGETAGDEGSGAQIDEMLAHFDSLGYALLYDRYHENPMYRGLRLDFCRHWGSECGWPAAESFCVNGLATNWAVADDVGPTRIIGTNQVCPDGSCDGFRFISCTVNRSRFGETSQ